MSAVQGVLRFRLYWLLELVFRTAGVPPASLLIDTTYQTRADKMLSRPHR